MNAETFWLKVAVGSPEECWPWYGAKGKRGYGNFWLGNKNHGAHRVAVMLAGTPIPPNCVVMHRCDNPGCVNPSHLRVGTHAENVADMVAKGRKACQKGERNNNARITEDEVRIIRYRLAAGATNKGLAREIGHSTNLVRDIRIGKTWKHVQ